MQTPPSHSFVMFPSMTKSVFQPSMPLHLPTPLTTRGGILSPMAHRISESSSVPELTLPPAELFVSPSLSSQANVLLLSLLAGEVSAAAGILSDHAADHDTLCPRKMEEHLLSLMHEPTLRHAYQQLSKQHAQKSTFKLAKPHLIYAFYCVLKRLAVPLQQDTTRQVVLFLASQLNWHAVHHVLNDLKTWDSDMYKLAIKSSICKRPRVDIEAHHVVERAQLDDHLSCSQKEELKMYMEDMARSESWEECKSQYETAWRRVLHQSALSGVIDAPPMFAGMPTHLQFGWHGAESSLSSEEREKLVDLGNAIMDICISYDKFEYGWSVYDALPQTDRHSLRVAMSLCRHAIKQLPTDGAESLAEQMKWEGRAWTVYMRARELRNTDFYVRVLIQMVEILSVVGSAMATGTKLIRLWQELQEHRRKHGYSGCPTTVDEKFLRGFATAALRNDTVDERLAVMCWEMYGRIKSTLAYPETFVMMIQLGARMSCGNSFERLCDEVRQLRKTDGDHLISRAMEKGIQKRLSASSLSSSIDGESVASLSRKSSAQSNSSFSSDVLSDHQEFTMRNDRILGVMSVNEALLVLESWTMRILED